MDTAYRNKLREMKSASVNCIKCQKCYQNLTKPMQCSRCFGVHYCSKDCQTNDWKKHKNNCKRLNKEKYESFLLSYQQAEIHVKNGNYILSEQYGLESLRIAEKVFHPDDIRIASPLVLLAQVKQHTHQLDMAISYFERAYHLYTNKSGSVDTHAQEVTFLLVNALVSSGDWNKACTFAEHNYQILVDTEGECTCYLIAETARQLGAIYDHFLMLSKEEDMFMRAIDHYSVCPDLSTRNRVDANFAKEGGYIGLLAKQLERVRERIEMSGSGGDDEKCAQMVK